MEFASGHGKFQPDDIFEVTAVIVVFKTRTAYVDECVESLQRLSGPRTLLMLVPDSEQPKKYKDAIVIPFPGTAAAKRNAALRALPPNIDNVAFIDSDAYAPADWLTRAVAFLRDESADVGALTGPNLTPPKDPFCRRIPGLAVESRLIMGLGAYRFTDRLASNLSHYPRATTCNLIVRRSVLDLVGGFDETLRTAEDVEFCDRVTAKGYRIVYDSSVVVFHHRRDIPRFLLQHFNEGLRLRRYIRFKRSGSILTFAPTLLLLLEIGLLGRGLFAVVAAIQALQLIAFFVDRRVMGVARADSGAAAVVMWAFLKCYGAGGVLSFFGGGRYYLQNRCDPPSVGGRSEA